MKTTSAVLVSLAWRILIALSTRTFFQPDEFFQSLEVAHRVVFGYGHLTWEWTASPPIRSVFFPALYMPVYWILKITGLDKGEALTIAPKVFQAIIASMTDISTRELARQLLGDRYANTAFILSLASIFHMLALGRTLSNSVETSFTTAALCFWPWHSIGSHRRLQLAFALVALSCLVRPTSVTIWSFLYADLCRRVRSNREVIRPVLVVSSTIAFFAAGCLLCIDSLCFGRVTFTPLNFVRTNLSSVSLFYGRAPWHYYFTQGLPILLNFYLPSFIFGAWDIWRRGLRHEKTVLGLIAWTVLVYSLLGHKEWRFLHPVLPLMFVVSAKSLVDGQDKSEPPPKSASTLNKNHPINFRLAIICILSVLPGVYVTRYHSRAQISVVSYLRSLDPSVVHSVGFLMPCHSTPWQAYLHRPELSEGRLWALSCEPPLHGVNISTYKDQTDHFYASPLTYLRRNFPEFVDPSFPPSLYPSTAPASPPPADDRWDHRWPSHLIFFGALLAEAQEGNEVEKYLREKGYVQVWEASNGFEEDWRRRGGVKVWQWKGRSVEA